MTVPTRLVVDTNALISRLLLPASVPAKAVKKAVEEADLLVSEETLQELSTVLARPKFDLYVTVNERQEFIRRISRIAVFMPVVHPIAACRDPKDDKFLALAVSGQAQTIVTGDRDLLELNPFQGIHILSPAEYTSAENNITK